MYLAEAFIYECIAGTPTLPNKEMALNTFYKLQVNPSF
jgi:hypothetical protein